MMSKSTMESNFRSVLMLKMYYGNKVVYKTCYEKKNHEVNDHPRKRACTFHERKNTRLLEVALLQNGNLKWKCILFLFFETFHVVGYISAKIKHFLWICWWSEIGCAKLTKYRAAVTALGSAPLR